MNISIVIKIIFICKFSVILFSLNRIKSMYLWMTMSSTFDPAFIARPEHHFIFFFSILSSKFWFPIAAFTCYFIYTVPSSLFPLSCISILPLLAFSVIRAKHLDYARQRCSTHNWYRTHFIVVVPKEKYNFTLTSWVCTSYFWIQVHSVKPWSQKHNIKKLENCYRG